MLKQRKEPCDHQRDDDCLDDPEEQGIKSQESVLEAVDEEAAHNSRQNETSCIPLLQLVQQLLRYDEGFRLMIHDQCVWYIR